ncbi:MAG: transporter substrate-binding domain-containing protein [Thermoflexaceae bacterium]|nr:transporter substrate-binding domain-containing protein [Thermoflexaceae bacterium]
MKKKILSVMLVACMAAVSLAGCASGSKEAETTKAETTAAETTAAETTASVAETTAAVAGAYDLSTEDIQNIIKRGKLEVGCKADVLKFGYQDTATGKYEGLEIDISYAIAGAIFGCTMEEAKAKDLCNFTAVTAATRGELLDNGTIDIVAATFTIKPDRLELWNFSTPYFTDHVGFLVKKDAGYKSAADLDGCIIGVASGSSTQKAIESYLAENNIAAKVTFQEFDTYPLISAALSTGNVDCFSVDRSILAAYNDDTTEILPDEFGPQDYGIATKKGNDGLTALVDQVVNEMISDGTMDSLLKSWGIE